MRNKISTLAGFGRTNDKHSSTWGSFILMLIRIGTWNSNRYTAIMRMRRSAYTRGGFWTLNTELSHPLFSLQRAVWERNACNTIADWRKLISIKKGEDYAKTISKIRARTSFALLRSALIWLTGSRARRKAFCDFKNVDIEIQEGAIM